ncbi:hypothetical protein Pedsa_2149 [Pseudopedobacter saltans DSM 12145]|uniref:tRNA (Guanine-N1)-methyltransferase n=1 Tax=Pseudopedobacter saltans (strain ATCC 51119 / DSM 12145 / JCM 21818 / CCUG 39354 / LMG 10337 / NBRC 100064 / NCIMB 13643) TaxID=762903 RepID=F0SB66_PSESL|nr:hypothetical protein [Pseudopedobacter saltans]ADY52701.1 hypothetical protein Pedsa_2149 [Pseudopedobacter saltans DSM 12145]
MNISKKITSVFIYFAFLFSINSKAATPVSPSLDEQFKSLFESSNNYQEYKVIKRAAFEKLWRSTSDSIKAKEKLTKNSSSLIRERDNAINKLKQDLSRKNEELQQAINSNNEISLLGFIPLQKANYNILICIVIALLIVACTFLYLKTNYANKVASEKRNLYEELSEEYRLFKTRSHENEKKLARALQDERNKLAEHNIL